MLSRKLAFCILHPQNRKLFELAKQHTYATLVWQKNHPLFRSSSSSSSTQPAITIEEEASQYEMELAISGEMFPPFPTLCIPHPRSRPVLQTMVNPEGHGDDEMYVMIDKDMFGADYYNSDA